MKYILFDTALNGLYSLHIIQQAYPDNISLFKNTKDENLFDVAPYLFKIDEQFFEKTGDPFISLKALIVFESDENREDLLIHFRPYIYKEIKGQENYFRFWDARVLSRFLPSCNEATLNAFFEGIERFYIIELRQKTAECFFISHNKLKIEQSPLSKICNVADETELTEQTEGDTNSGKQSEKKEGKFFK